VSVCVVSACAALCVVCCVVCRLLFLTCFSLVEVTYAKKVRAGKSVTINYEIDYAGRTDVPEFQVGFYLSTDNQITTSDSLLSSSPLKLLNTGSRRSQQFESKEVTIPEATKRGKYFLGVFLDTDISTGDTTPNDNAFPGQKITVIKKRKKKKDSGNNKKTGKKVKICHKPEDKPQRTIKIAKRALKKHLRHGDTKGACE